MPFAGRRPKRSFQAKDREKAWDKKEKERAERKVPPTVM